MNNDNSMTDDDKKKENEKKEFPIIENLVTKWIEDVALDVIEYIDKKIINEEFIDEQGKLVKDLIDITKKAYIAHANKDIIKFLENAVKIHIDKAIDTTIDANKSSLCAQAFAEMMGFNTKSRYHILGDDVGDDEGDEKDEDDNI